MGGYWKKNEGFTGIVDENKIQHKDWKCKRGSSSIFKFIDE